MGGTYAKLQLSCKLSADFEELLRIFVADPPDQFFWDNQYLTGAGLSSVIDIPNGASDQALNIGGLTSIKVVAIFTNGKVSVRFVGAGTSIPIGDAGRPGFLVLGGSGVTSLLISNSSGGVVQLRYMVGGS